MAEFPQVIARKHSFQVAIRKANTFNLFALLTGHYLIETQRI